jgi:hypothetical protein
LIGCAESGRSATTNNNPHEVLALKPNYVGHLHIHVQYERFQQVCLARSKTATFFSSVAARAAFIANVPLRGDGHGESNATDS